MKILNLTTYYFPEQVASSHLTADLEEVYRENGIETILHVPTPTRGVSGEVRKQYKKIKYEERLDTSIKIHRFHMFSEPKNNYMRAFRYILIQFIQYFRCISEKEIDVVYCTSTPPTQGVLAVIVSKCLSLKYKKHIPVVYNLQDIFPESVVTTGLSKKNSLVYKIGDEIANYTYKNVDKIIAISEEFKRILLNKGVPENKVEVIYNWVDKNKVINIPREKNKLFDEYNLDRNKFYISYSGNIGMTQNMDMLLDVAKELQDKDDIGFILVGEGVYKTQVEKRIKEERINNVTLIPFQPYARISEVFSLGNVGLIISKKGVGSNSVPSKTWSYMSAERPLLVSFDEGSELSNLVKKIECGIAVPADDADALFHAIKKMIQDKSRCEQVGKTGRKYIETYIDKNKCTEKYFTLISDVIQ